MEQHSFPVSSLACILNARVTHITCIAELRKWLASVLSRCGCQLLVTCEILIEVLSISTTNHRCHVALLCELLSLIHFLASLAVLAQNTLRFELTFLFNLDACL